MAETRAKGDRPVLGKRPVLMVGLGGTGKQVLINLRRKIFEAYGKPLYPYIGHIMVDTDTRSLTLDGKEYDFLSRMVDFDKSERLDVELKMSDLRKIQDRATEYPHIHNWFDGRLFAHGEISNGAAQIRSFGRLAFFMNYSAITGNIANKITKLQSMAVTDPLLAELNVRVDTNALDVWIIFSIAGGTGAGMFLDTAFAIKSRWPNANIRGIIVLPSVFSDDLSHRIFANAYSALMELEHYNLDRGARFVQDDQLDDEAGEPEVNLHRFPLAWTEALLLQGDRLPGPVFQSTLIVDNKPRGISGAVQVDQKNALCDMIAEHLFVEYGFDAEPLADSLRSARSNFAGSWQNRVTATYAQEPFPLSETFACLYGSFGLAKLHVPVDRISSLVRYRLARDICRSWFQSNTVPADLDERFETDLAPRLMLSSNRRVRSIAREIDNLESASAITEQIIAMVGEKKSEMLSKAAVPAVGKDVREWTEVELMRGQLDCGAPTPSDWGQKSRAILIANVEKLETRLKRELDRIVEENLAEPTRRFTLARAWLRRAHELYTKLAVDLTRQMDTRRNAAARDAREASERLDWLADCSGTFTRRTILSVTFDFVEARAVKETEAQLQQAAAELCRRMADHIGSGTIQKDAGGKETLIETGLIKQLGDLESLLQDDLDTTLKNRLDALQRGLDNPINVNLFEADDIDTFYRLNDGRRIDIEAIRDLDRRFFEEAAVERYTSLWGMRASAMRPAPERLMNDLVRFAGRLTDRHLEGQSIHAIDRLGEMFKPSDPKFEGQVSKLIENGNPWLGLPTHHWLSDQSASAIRVSRYVALAKDDGSDANLTFREILDRNKDIASQVVASTPDRVYVVSETAGQPLMAIPNLDRYRNDAYRPLVGKESVHGDHNIDKFGDLLPLHPREALNYKRVLRSVAGGLLLGILKMRKDGAGSGAGRQLSISMVNTLELGGRDEEFGPMSVAIWLLSREGGKRWLNQLDQALRDDKGAWGDSDHARFVALLHHNSRSGRVPHGDLAQAMSALAAEELRTDPHLRDDANQELRALRTWAVEQPARSGIYVMRRDSGKLI